MIATLEAHCKELDEKKLQFERMIHALRLEEATAEAKTVVGDDVQADDAENDAACDDVVADSEDKDEDSGTSRSDSV
ncbi:hypothetical protein A2U01_0067652 [Trifolium medium]|uniref:Uncharacterized protein n=1 Tax=Trifolium medium TaxID=97028 RepID=A0A392SD87_9FABA|nr:hypothetical protein [Trifolium medium]